MNSTLRDLRQGVFDVAPVLVAATPIGLLWGTLAAGKGLSPFESWLMSATVFAGAAQFVAIEVWRDPVPGVLLTVTALIVNIRHVLMGASLSRHMGGIDRRWHPAMMFLMADENWAFSERRALKAPLSLGYYFGLALPMWFAWTTSSTVGAIVGRSFGDPAVYGFDFAFSAMFIGILAGFWKGPRTGAVLGASAIAAALAKLYVPGAWYIVIGGIVGMAVAALLYRRGETS
ncbi:MAG TPA: AzlC family ABC transporter permease [Aestuariivirga sp.]|jgi:branched chain amino acid efflux pump